MHVLFSGSLVLLNTTGRMTNADGRCLDLLPPRDSEEARDEHTQLRAGQTYKIIFKTKEYFKRTNRSSFYPWVEVCHCASKWRRLSRAFSDQLRH